MLFVACGFLVGTTIDTALTKLGYVSEKCTCCTASTPARRVRVRDVCVAENSHWTSMSHCSTFRNFNGLKQYVAPVRLLCPNQVQERVVTCFSVVGGDQRSMLIIRFIAHAILEHHFILLRVLCCRHACITGLQYSIKFAYAIGTISSFAYCY